MPLAWNVRYKAVRSRIDVETGNEFQCPTAHCGVGSTGPGDSILLPTYNTRAEMHQYQMLWYTRCTGVGSISIGRLIKSVPSLIEVVSDDDSHHFHRRAVRRYKLYCRKCFPHCRAPYKCAGSGYTTSRQVPTELGCGRRRPNRQVRDHRQRVASQPHPTGAP